MIDLSLAGLFGAVAGTAVAAINYHVTIGFIERSLRAHEQSRTAEERDTFDRKLSMLRRIVLAVDVFVFAALGYWIGTLIAG
jgi:hypothetical protein